MAPPPCSSPRVAIGPPQTDLGEARAWTDRRMMKDLWHEEPRRWFEDGLDTQGLVMLRVDAKRVQWWGEQGGPLEL